MIALVIFVVLAAAAQQLRFGASHHHYTLVDCKGELDTCTWAHINTCIVVSPEETCKVALLNETTVRAHVYEDLVCKDVKKFFDITLDVCEGDDPKHGTGGSHFERIIPFAAGEQTVHDFTQKCQSTGANATTIIVYTNTDCTGDIQYLISNCNQCKNVPCMHFSAGSMAMECGIYKP